MNGFRVFACFICLILNIPANAQQQQYKFKHIDANQGLSHNEVNCFLKDRRGFLWIGTSNGLNRFDGYSIKSFLHNNADSSSLSFNLVTRLYEAPDGKIIVTTPRGLDIYDPQKENFGCDIQAFYDAYKLPPGGIQAIVKDTNGNYWFVHDAGIIRFNGKTKISTLISHNPTNKKSISSNLITAFVQDGNTDNFWLIHRNGIIELLNANDGEINVSYRNDFLFKENQGVQLDYRLTQDADGDLWICVARGKDMGAFYFNVREESFTHFHKNSKQTKLNTDVVRGIVQDNQGKIWIGTDHGGINVIDKNNFTVEYVYHIDGDPQSLSHNSILNFYKDDSGIIWVGTYKMGVNYFHEYIIRFPLYKRNSLEASSLPYEDINRFVEDERGNLWIGTNGGGLIYYDRSKKTFKRYLHNPADLNSLSSDVIVSLFMDHQKKLWIGTFLGGLNCWDGHKFLRYKVDESDPNSLNNPNVWELFEDSQNRLWVGALSGGLHLYDRKKQTFSHFKSNEPGMVRSNYINVIMEDSEGDIWIGGDFGLDIASKETGKFTHLKNSENDLGFILDAKEDQKGRMWISTHGGLHRLDKTSKKITTYTMEDGLPHSSILTILIDDNGNLWLGTLNGICYGIVTESPDGMIKVSFITYDEADGLQGKQFNENAALKTKAGELIFAGARGFNLFKPEQIGADKIPPHVVFSDFQLYNNSIDVGEEVDGKILLNKAVPELDHITLSHNQKVFSISFAALNYFHPEKNIFQYKLEGFHKDWLSIDSKSPKVTFTNLDPGNYTFKVKVASREGMWNEKGASLNITILPPFWKTPLAVVLYGFFILMLLWTARKLVQQRELDKFQRQQALQEAMRMHELDMMKIKFFTNISHEFKTPLTLILTPLETIIKRTREPEQKEQLNVMQRNAKRLLNLVNQLLDFRKLEGQETRLNSSEGDIIHFIKEIVHSFSDLSEKKDVKLEFKSSINSLETLFDKDKLERIMFNLLSNAFKFTPSQGAVLVEVDLQENDTEKKLVVNVRDTGIGIPTDQLEKIFDRFFQNQLPTSVINQGSGIGLSIAKEFVKMHGGTISAKSELGMGSCFTFDLPVKEVLNPNTGTEVTESSTELNEMQIDVGKADRENGTLNRPLLLLAEDNDDFRSYLKNNLKIEYNILEAKDGHDAWKSALLNVPDLIVSDVMMPNINGLELCKKIKADQRTSHIPVILLTARTGEEQKLEGYEKGADDYITKPFNFEILSLRIKNLIAQRLKIHKAFASHHSIKAHELNIESLDEKFIQRAIKTVEENISNSEFSVEDLSQAMGMSRTHFYRKVLSLTGKSPLEFIRLIRLQQAAQLLERSQLTVAEIAYQVGFNNPKYFTKYFKETYHMLPSVYASEKKRH